MACCGKRRKKFQQEVAKAKEAAVSIAKPVAPIVPPKPVAPLSRAARIKLRQERIKRRSERIALRNARIQAKANRNYQEKS